MVSKEILVTVKYRKRHNKVCIYYIDGTFQEANDPHDINMSGAWKIDDRNQVVFRLKDSDAWLADGCSPGVLDAIADSILLGNQDE